MKKINNGFSLIELMVVVAVIALLSALSMQYLGSAKKRGDDTAVKTNLATVRAVSEIFFLENGNSYLPSGGSNFSLATCPVYNASGVNMLSVSKPVADSIAEATKRGIGNACANSSARWAVAVGLKEVPGSSWCVDAEGAAKVVNTTPSLAIDGSNFICY